MPSIFTKIISREIPAEIIYEDDNTIAFLDINPTSLGHSLIVPKKESSTIIDTNEETIANLFIAVKKVTLLLKKALNPDGFSIGLNQGLAGGQTIDHIHVHIIPRYQGDGGGNMHSIVQNKPKESLAKVREMIEKKS
jgi:histidine triad (HIT) family protein